MRKRNNKKRTVYTVLLIVIAILVVGYAALSATLNIFGGLSVIGGNNWGIKWNNIVVNEDSTAVVTYAPSITYNDHGSNNQVNFQVTLNRPGDFYEFTVDAVNTGTIDAMISSVDYQKLNASGEPVDVEFLNCSVTYSNDIQLSSGHLLAAGQTATYKVRVEYSSDISGDELPSGEEAYRFEFAVTYIQADDTAYVPGESNLPEIPNAVDYGYDIPNGTYYRVNSNHAFLQDNAYDIGPVFTSQNDIPSTVGFDFALKHNVSNEMINSVGMTFRYNNRYSDITWTENCYNGTLKNTLNTIFSGSCDDYSDMFICSDGESMDLQFYDDSSLVVSNGVYTCSISPYGESYCFGG